MTEIAAPLLYSIWLFGMLKVMVALKEKFYPDRSPSGAEIVATFFVCLIWPVITLVYCIGVILGKENG
jgi:hypothetical protein